MLVYNDLISIVARIVSFGISFGPCMTFKKCVVSFMYEGEVSTIGLVVEIFREAFCWRIAP